ncbi:MAG TPA: endonuclease III [Candidatus Nitrosotenuis sp.]|nr:endonuclease III [Candidatus Nitrosotenuis sp.]
MDEKKVRKILEALEAAIPDSRTELNWSNPFELLIATILSAQCTDEKVNQVTPRLFARFPTPQALAAADPAEVEEIIKPTGFFRQKARSIIACSQALVERFGGQVPQDMESLTSLPGVGRKTANLILGQAFGVPGVVVDTHVKRVARRIGFTTSQDPEEVEADLARWLPRSQWTSGSSRLLLHGRYVCLARRPRCPECPILKYCEYDNKTC